MNSGAAEVFSNIKKICIFRKWIIILYTYIYINFSINSQIDVLRSSHQNEFQKMLADNAIQHSASKMAELQSKTDAQQVIV